MIERPYFFWDIPITEQELRLRLQHDDARIRAQWQGVVMREACYRDVWHYLSLAEILRDWEHIERHLGRRRRFWQWLLQGWRDDGLLAGGIDLAQAFDDAETKEVGADPGTLALLLDELRIAPEARLPGDVLASELDRFRRDLVRTLRQLAFRRARLE